MISKYEDQSLIGSAQSLKLDIKLVDREIRRKKSIVVTVSEVLLGKCLANGVVGKVGPGQLLPAARKRGIPVE